MATWELTLDKSGRKRCYWGKSNASLEGDVVCDLVEMWLVLFRDQLTWYPPDRWDSIIGNIQLSHGSLALSPAMGLNLLQMVPGCSLYFSPIHNFIEGEFELDAEFDAAYDQAEATYIGLVMQAWMRVRAEEDVLRILKNRPIPFQLLNEPDQPPVIEMLLEVGQT